MKFIVVGFPKCGQHSLVEYLKGRGYDVEREDIIWKTNAAQEIETRWADRVPIIISRDPIEMIWSSYWYWPYHTYMTFAEYLNHKIEGESSLGTENPIQHSDYAKHLAKFPRGIWVTLEEMSKNPNFPHENITPDKPEISNQERVMVEKHLAS